MKNLPEILAPAGNKQSFLAALAAGADSIYCGLKLFSARMTADNFSLNDLASLSQLAGEMNVKVYLAFNTLLKNSNIDTAYKSICEAVEYIKPDAFIIQDLASSDLIKKTGYTGELHYSTLSNITHPTAIKSAEEFFNADRIVLPRELSLEEIKICSKSCSTGLEVFIHGALCYGVSGRCYWSSYLGGKSGLRGRCVQPCRRLYIQDNSTARFFSCMDLGLEDSVKSLLTAEKVKAWKIEGRKKGPHYVFSTVRAYKLLRDNIDNPDAVKDALVLLNSSLGRKKTQYYFNKIQQVSPVQESGESGSGQLIGKINNEKGKIYFTARGNLVKGDLLRIGYEDSESGDLIKIDSFQEADSRIDITRLLSAKMKSGTPVFLIDRRDDDLIRRINELENKLVIGNTSAIKKEFPKIDYSSMSYKKKNQQNIFLSRSQDESANSYWIDYDIIKNLPDHLIKSLWWWLPPVIWPKEEKNIINLIKYCIEKNCRNFVLNSPWQLKFFNKTDLLNLWAGPFCNISNSISVKILSEKGFCGVMISPELSGEDILSLPETSALPLGIYINGSWPVCISRAKPGNLKFKKSFSSELLEEYWTDQPDANFWTYPNWILDLTPKLDLLKSAGYSLFVYNLEKEPGDVDLKKRKGLWNWDHGLM
jgi:putative protease